MALTKKKKMLLIGGGVVLAGVAGYFAWTYYNKSQGLAPSLNPPAATGNVQTVQLSPGSAGSVTLSLGNHDAVSLVAPTGSTLGAVSMSPDGIVVTPSSGANYEYVAAAVGSTTITATYTDTSGATQTTTISVTVTA